MSRQRDRSWQAAALILVGVLILTPPAGLSLAQGSLAAPSAAGITPTVPGVLNQTDTVTPTQTETATKTSTSTPTDSTGGDATDQTGDGQTLVVDNDHADCTDAGFTTIQAAVDSAPAGTTVRVCAGTYPESVTVETADLTIRADGNAGIESSAEAAVRINASGVTLSGFDISVDQGVKKAIVVGGQDTLVRDNTVNSPRGDGIFLSDGRTAQGESDSDLGAATGSRIVNNTVKAYNWRIWADSDKTVIRNNNVSDLTDISTERRTCDGRECEGANLSIVSSGNENVIRNNTVQYNYHPPTLFSQVGSGIQIGLDAAPKKDERDPPAPPRGAKHDMANNNLVVDNHVSGGPEAGIRLLQVATGTVVRNNTLPQNLNAIIVWSNETVVRNNTIPDGLTPGAHGVHVRSTANVRVFENTITSYGEGVVVSRGHAVIIGNTIQNSQSVGVVFGGVHNEQPGTGRVVDNQITNNGEYGIEIGDGGDPTQIEIHANLINNNQDLGIYNANSSLIVNATNNIWDCGGPSSGFEPFADPYTGRLANGSGDAISGGNGSTRNGHPISNVHFDPFQELSSCPEQTSTPTDSPTATSSSTPTPTPPPAGDSTGTVTEEGGGGGTGNGDGDGDGGGETSGADSDDSSGNNDSGGTEGDTATPPPTATATASPTATPQPTPSPTPAVEPGFGVLTWLLGVTLLVSLLVARRRAAPDGEKSND